MRPLADVRMSELQWSDVKRHLPIQLRASVRGQDDAYKSFIEAVLWIIHENVPWVSIPADVFGKEGARTAAAFKDARLTADSTEAVTGRQLKTNTDALAAMDMRLASNRDDMAEAAGDVARNAAGLADVKAAAQIAAGDARVASTPVSCNCTTSRRLIWRAAPFPQWKWCCVGTSSMVREIRKNEIKFDRNWTSAS